MLTVDLYRKVDEEEGFFFLRLNWSIALPALRSCRITDSESILLRRLTGCIFYSMSDRALCKLEALLFVE